MATDLALVPEGRYNLYSESYRDVSWTPFGTASIAEWGFETAPAETTTSWNCPSWTST